MSEASQSQDGVLKRPPRTPCYVLDTALLKKNLQVLADVQERAGCKILLALKGFATWSVFDIVRQYLAGVAASSLHEARLGREEFAKPTAGRPLEVHVCAPAYRDDEFGELVSLVDHVVFNSFSQWQHFRGRVRPGVSCGLRINPQHSEVKVRLYDPCAPGSRLGIVAASFGGADVSGIEGLHFHTLCELNSDALERTLGAVEAGFGKHLAGMRWVNFGGGHHITRSGYDLERLVRLILDFRKRYNVAVYLEPGEAIALDAGYLVASVLDIVHNDCDIAILDTSAAAHMPDVLEMPYKPRLVGAGEPGEYRYTYRLGGLSCLAGDVIGDYSFPQPLVVGQRLVFLDMAHYTMVKNNTFNGLRLPDIVVFDSESGKERLVKTFGYEDYRDRLS